MSRSLEYLAGLFDGEGSFSIQVGVRPQRAGRVSGWVSPSMAVNLYYGTEVLTDFVDVFGGQIYPYTKNGAPCGARWHLGRRTDLLVAVAALEPHLVIKKDIARRFAQALMLYPVRGGVDQKKGGRTWTAERVIEVAEIALTLNPPRSRTCNKTLEYIDVLRVQLAQDAA